MAQQHREVGDLAALLEDQAILALGGEVVIEYALELKRMFGPDIFVMGYANDEAAYIPSETVLAEGGYEGESSQRVYGLPAKWGKDIQKKILAELETLAGTLAPVEG